MVSLRRNKKGFTLIEIIVVIAIIAILGGIVAGSIYAVYRKSEKKAATSKLTESWSITTTAFHQINRGFTTFSSPNVNFLSTRLGTTKIILGTNECESLAKDYIYIRYEYNPKSVSNKYKVVCIWTNKDGNYYYTTDGKNVIGPQSAP